jgi:hypothetical protein
MKKIIIREIIATSKISKRHDKVKLMRDLLNYSINQLEFILSTSEKYEIAY